MVDSIDNSAFCFKLPPPQELYTVIISLAVPFPKAELWETTYNFFVRQVPPGCFCIKASGAVRIVIPALRVCIESLAANEKFTQWCEHLLWPSAALKARVRDDARRLAVKFYSDGNSVAVAQAKTILNEEIDHVMSLHFVMLERYAPSNVKYMYKPNYGQGSIVVVELSTRLGVRV